MKSKPVVWGTILLALVLPMLLLISIFQTVQATTPEGVWGDPHFGFVVDTTETMQPEIDALVTALQSSSYYGISYTHHLVGFKNQPLYRGNTTNLNELVGWIENLEVGGGGNCPDNALGGLREMAKNLPNSERPASEVLLLTDATPIGKRQAYAFMADKLLQRGVRVNSIISGWCEGAPLPLESLAYITLASGGRWYYPITSADNFTNTLIALGVMNYQDAIISRRGEVTPGFPENLTFPIDSTITTLGVEDKDPKTWCLTCTMPIDNIGDLSNGITIVAGNGVEVELIDPDGNVIGPGTTGYSSLQSSLYQWQTLDSAEGGPIYPGGWEVRISGEGKYYVNVRAVSSLHMAYLGRHTLTRGRPVRFRAALINEGLAEGGGIASADFRILSLNGQQSVPIDLFDDGQHGDGDPGDGIYGGLVTPPAPGMYRLGVQGELNDGTTFRRVDPAPIRVQRHRLPDPPGRVSLPDSTAMSTFTLSNEDDTEKGDSTTFDLLLSSSQGWTITGTLPTTITLAPGESFTFDVETVVPAGAPAGALEEVTLTAVPIGNISGGISAFAEITVVDQLPLFLPIAVKP